MWAHLGIYVDIKILCFVRRNPSALFKCFPVLKKRVTIQIGLPISRIQFKLRPIYFVGYNFILIFDCLHSFINKGLPLAK